MAVPGLTFTEDGHVYRLDGRVVPSVTQRITAAGLGADYSKVDPAVLEHASQRGLHVEQCCQMLSEGDLDPASVHEEARPYVEAYTQAVSEYRITDLRWQVMGYSEADDTAGTSDIWCQVRGRPSIIDVKCVYKLARAYRLQLAAYRRMHPVSDASRYILHLKKSGGYVLVDCDEAERVEGADDDATWRACVAVAQWKGIS